jgi:hypothetical protein
LRSTFTEARPPKAFDTRDSLFERQCFDVLSVEVVGLLERVGDAEHALDHMLIIAER